MELTTEFDVINAATDVIEEQLGLLEALCDANKYRMDESSRLMCRCPSCRGENVALIGWLWGVRHPEPENRRAELLRQYRLARRN
jgi:hypothetical protein